MIVPVTSSIWVSVRQIGSVVEAEVAGWGSAGLPGHP